MMETSIESDRRDLIGTNLQDGWNILLTLPDSLETFLQKWTMGMRRVGVLEHTTAKREDCIASFHGFLRPLLAEFKQGRFDVDFPKLLRNDRNWAEFLLKEGRLHRSRGINLGMFLVGFKPLVHALEEIVRESDAAPQAKLVALELLRLYADAYEVLVIREMNALSESEIQKTLDETNRQLTMEKCTLENVLASTSDLILLMDTDGVITRANEAARSRLKQTDLQGCFLGEILNLDADNIDTLLKNYPLNQHHEITLFERAVYFQLQLVPLQHVSLASRGYLVLLSDITLFAKQRQILQQQFKEQSVELADTEKQYQSLFEAAGESILLLDPQTCVIQANHRTGSLFGCALEDMMGRTCRDFCSAESAMKLCEAAEHLDREQVWSGELTGRRSLGEFFPMAATLTRVELDSGPLLQMLVRDITEQKAMQGRLEHEKKQLEEANIALRHVMKTIGREQQDLQQNLTQRVQSQLLPALEKARRANSESVRQGYLEILHSQLDLVASDAGNRIQGRLFKLTPAEMKVCQFIQAGVSSKEMAATMNLAVETIQTHRKNIRKKLGLSRDINLYSYLQELHLSF